MIGRTGVISLWMIVLATRTHKMFNWKILAAGILALIPVMMVWYYPYNFILWNWATDATGQLIGHAFTVIYYTIWCVALAAAFKGEMP